MKVPLSWIKEYVEIKETTEKLAADLQFSGTKVESIERIGDETIFDFEITPNRADCLSVIGIAREIAAIYNRKLTIPKPFSDTNMGSEAKSIDFFVSDKKLSPSYSVGVIDSVKIGSSPPWLVSKLENCGVRSINNIVDVSNYVMLETGQPMHTFDFDKISGSMRLRASKKGEKVKTLDSVERQLPEGAIIIEDSEKIIDLAGLMGGENSEVDKDTTTLVLHVPLYDPVSIRRASNSLGLRSEASNRFEKRLDPAAHRYTFERAAQLISTLTGGKLVSKIKSVGYPTKERDVALPVSLIQQTLGIKIGDDEIENILCRLEFAIKNRNGKKGLLEIVIPSFRTDVNEAVDMTEEVGRIYGYNKFPKTLPVGTPPILNFRQTNFEKDLKQVLTDLGLKEIYSSSLTSAAILESLGVPTQKTLKIANRLVIDYEYLRPSLLVGLIIAACLNIKRFGNFSLYEVGKVFAKPKNPTQLPPQPKRVAALFFGSTYHAAKGALEALFKKLNIANVTYKTSEKREIFGKSAAEIFLGTKSLGFFGNLDEKALADFDIVTTVFGFELDFDTLKESKNEAFYKPIPKFPLVKENLSLFLPENVTFSHVADSVGRGAADNLYKLDLLEDTTINEKRSILVEVEYFDAGKTLTKEKITSIRNNVTHEIRKLGAQIRE